jgi:hypothetical protein
MAIQKLENDQHVVEIGVYEKMYLKKRKQMRMIIAVVIVLIVITIGGFFYIVNRDARHNKPLFGPHASAAFRSNFSVMKFFNSDGSVNMTKVDRAESRIPSQYQSQASSFIGSKIDAAISDGEITSSQGAALKQAFGIQ